MSTNQDTAATLLLALQDLFRRIDEVIERKLRAHYVDLSRAIGTVPRGNLSSGGDTGTGYTPADNSVTTAKLADGAVSVAKLAFDPATQAELNDHIATRGDADFGHVKPDGTTILSAGGVLSVSGSAIGSTTLLGLSDVPDSYSGQALKPLRAKADETGVEFYTPTPPTVAIPFVSTGTSASRTWNSMPLAETEIFATDQHQMYMDLSNYSEALLQGRFGGGVASGMILRAQYSLDTGTTWHNLDGSTGPQVAMFPTTSSSTSNLRAGSWSSITSAAKTWVLLRLVGAGGTGAANPNIGQVILLLR